TAKASLMKSAITTGLAVSITLVLSACASGSSLPDAGERITQRGQDIEGFGKSWSEGQKNVDEGQKSLSKSARNLAKAERDLARARADVALAERQINEAAIAKVDARARVADGSLKMMRAEAAYAAARAGPS